MNVDNTEKPDHEIEQFWLSYKQSMFNFYNSSTRKEQYIENIKTRLHRPINQWCDYLNGLQLIQKYDEIEENIHNYISLYAIDLMRSNDKYHCRILTTNIKRWDKISNKYKISAETNNKYHNLVFALLDIYTSLINSYIDASNVFSQIELFLLYSDFTSLIRLAIGHNKSGILEKLFNYNPNIYRQIEVMYGVDEGSFKNMSGMKIIKKINIF